MASIIYCLDCGYPMAYSQSDLKGSNLQHETADGKIHKNTAIVTSDEIPIKGTDGIDDIRVILATYLEKDIDDIPQKPIADADSIPVTKKDVIRP